MPNETGKSSPQDTELGGVLRNVEDLLNSHEVSLGAMGLFIGYICVFLVKIMNLTNMYFGVCLIVITTLLLLLLDKGKRPKTWDWWARAGTVILLNYL